MQQRRSDDNHCFFDVNASFCQFGEKGLGKLDVPSDFPSVYNASFFYVATCDHLGYYGTWIGGCAGHGCCVVLFVVKVHELIGVKCPLSILLANHMNPLNHKISLSLFILESFLPHLDQKFSRRDLATLNF